MTDRPSGGWEMTYPDGHTEEFGVMIHPYRKSPMLYHQTGGMIRALGYFRNDENAETFLRLMKDLNGGRLVKEDN